MPSLSAVALPQIGAIRIVADLSDWINRAYQGQLLRSPVPPSDPFWQSYAYKVRIRPTYVIGSQFSQFGQTWEMLSGFVDMWYDTEATLDQPWWYILETIGGDASYVYSQTATQLVANSDFETDIAGWQADNGTLTRETAAPIIGTGSLRLAVTGTPSTAGARPTVRYTVTPGRRHMASAYLRPSAGTGQARLAIDWYTAANAFISTSFSPQTTMSAGVATRRVVRATAPGTAARADVRVHWGTPPAGAVMVADRVELYAHGDATSAGSSSPVTLSSQGGGWLHNPEQPAGSMRLALLPDTDCEPGVLVDGLMFLSYSGQVRAAAGARFDIGGQPEPAVVVATRKSPSATLTVAALTFTDRDTVVDELYEGSVMMLRLPTEFGISDRYLDIGDTTETALTPDLRRQHRVIDLPHQVVGPPDSPTAGVLGNRFIDLDRYATWSAFDAAQLTSLDLLYGAGSTQGIGAL